MNSSEQGRDGDKSGHSGNQHAWRAKPVRRSLVVVSALIVLALIAAAVYFWRAESGIKRSSAIASAGQSGARPSRDLNLLVMGLDSRVDVNGNPLPADMYQALHAGDASDGGLNANVLMYVHIPADGSRATVIAIPRDDYVDLPGCPDGQCKAKIKEAYGLAADQKAQELKAQGKTGPDAYQASRDAGRAAEVATVKQFLNVPIDHFVEVTMVAFLQIAQVVQPITVCVKQDTVDTYSGANFKAGVQQIDAAQAVAFVRQRRDTSNPGLEFTDLDRSRRQQAFIASLFTKLKQTNYFADPAKIDSLIKVAQQNSVIDSALSLSDLASLAASMDGSKMHFYTLPIQGFGTDPEGQSINTVDPHMIRAIVQSLLSPASPSAPATPSNPASPSASAVTSNPASPSSPSPSAVDATGGGSTGPAPTQLTEMAGGGIPCVK